LFDDDLRLAESLLDPVRQLIVELCRAVHPLITSLKRRPPGRSLTAGLCSEYFEIAKLSWL
jgi:hypothetical protein